MGMCERNLVRRIPCRHLLGLKPGFDKKYLLKKEKLGSFEYSVKGRHKGVASIKAVLT